MLFNGGREHQETSSSGTEIILKTVLESHATFCFSNKIMKLLVATAVVAEGRNL